VLTRRLTVAVLGSLVCAAAAAAAGTGTSVKIAVSTPTPWTVVGENVGISGTVSPHPAGLELTLQHWYGSGWLPVGTTAARADGGFTFRYRATKPGASIFRVVTSKETGVAGASGKVAVRVFRWRYLSDIEQFQYINPIVGDLSLEPITAGGAHYAHPVTMDAGCYNGYDGSAWVDFPLERRYELFTATMGLGGYATTGSTATYDLVGGDGKKLASGSLAYGGAPQKVKVSVEGEYRLRLVINVPDPTHAAGCSTSFTQVVFGDAQLLGP
jgi:NPCBM/NEW2 domain